MRAAPVRGHLDQVDLFRILTFASVVAVHAFAFSNPHESVAANGVAVVLHFTREAFFFLTGLVLVHAQGARELDVRRFWRKRFTAIGVPYLVWSVLYWGYGLLRDPRPAGRATSDLVWGVLGGHAEYHLYFLLVSMQVYLVFALLLALVRAARSRPWALTLPSLAYEVAVMAWLHRHPGASTWVDRYAYLLLPSYLLWVVLGAQVAQHLEAVQAAVARHARAVAVAGLLAVGASVAWYAHVVAAGAAPGDEDAAAVLQPSMVLDSLGVVALLGVLALRYGSVRDDHPAATAALRWGSSASFGVYLVHPLVLDGVLALGLAGPEPTLVPQPVASPLAWALTLAGSVAVVAVLRKTPLSLPLTGRARPRPSSSPRPAALVEAS